MVLPGPDLSAALSLFPFSLSLSFLQSLYFQGRCPDKQRAAINCIKMRFSSNILQTASNRSSTDKEQLACQTPQYKQQLTKNTPAADCGQYILQNKVKVTRPPNPDPVHSAGGNKSQLAENPTALLHN